MEQLSEWLTQKLQEHGWSQSELARRAGVSKQVISVYINQRRDKPDEAVLSSLAHALGSPPEEVFRVAGMLPAAPSPATSANGARQRITRRSSPPGQGAG